MEDIDLEGVDTLGREVRRVEGDDGSDVRTHCGGKNVAVLWIAGHRFDESLVPRGRGSRERGLHLVGEAVNRCGRDIGCDQIPTKFLKNVVGPSGAI